MAPNAKESLTNYNLNSLQNYNNLYKLTKFIIEFISSRIGECNINHLRIIFEEMDTNKNGILTLNEIKEGINKMSEIANMDEEEKEEILKNFDTENRVAIEYNEFIASCLEQKSYLREEYLLDVFMMLDLDGSGKISKPEIKFALSGDLDDETLERLIQDFDLNGDGEIDYREFLIGMANLNKKEEEVKEEKIPPKKHK